MVLKESNTRVSRKAGIRTENEEKGEEMKDVCEIKREIEKRI